MDLVDIKYHDVQESFGMGGPYLGELEFKGKLITGKFLADSEIFSGDKERIVFSRYLGQYTTGFLGLRTKYDFRIFVYDIKENRFYQSKNSYDCLSIEKMTGNFITFYHAFHTTYSDYRDTIEFSFENFERIEI